MEESYKQINERFLDMFSEVKKRYHMKTRDLCKELGVHPNHMTDYRNMVRRVPLTSVQAMQEKYDVSEEYVVFGRGGRYVAGIGFGANMDEFNANVEKIMKKLDDKYELLNKLLAKIDKKTKKRVKTK